MEESQKPLREALFAARAAFHANYNPLNQKDAVFPPGYDSVRKWTRLIQEERDRAHAVITAKAVKVSRPGTRQS